MNNERLRENVLELAKIMDGIGFNYSPDHARKKTISHKFNFPVFENYVTGFEKIIALNINEGYVNFNKALHYFGYSFYSINKDETFFNKVKSFLGERCLQTDIERVIKADIALNLFYTFCWYKLERIKHSQQYFEVRNPRLFFPKPTDIFLQFVNLRQMLDLGIDHDIATYFLSIKKRKGGVK